VIGKLLLVIRRLPGQGKNRLQSVRGHFALTACELLLEEFRHVRLWDRPHIENHSLWI
jgi:hypothetical protein